MMRGRDLTIREATGFRSDKSRVVGDEDMQGASSKLEDAVAPSQQNHSLKLSRILTVQLPPLLIQDQNVNKSTLVSATKENVFVATVHQTVSQDGTKQDTIHGLFFIVISAFVFGW